MWKEPSRKTRSQITQSFNSGVVCIYTVTNVAQPGRRPVESPVLKFTLRYEEQRLGINRLYMSRQNQAEIVRVLRIPRVKAIYPQDIAITEDGEQYRIDYTQSVSDAWPDCLDMSLTKIEQKIDIEVES